MVFDHTNARQISAREFSLHDDVLTEFRFDRAAYRATLLISSREKGNYKAFFHDVIGFEMTSCDFWGPSPHILDFEYVEATARILIPKLRKENEKSSIPRRNPIDDEHYIETVLTFSSGDLLRIACKTIQIAFGNPQKRSL